MIDDAFGMPRFAAGSQQQQQAEQERANAYRQYQEDAAAAAQQGWWENSPEYVNWMRKRYPNQHAEGQEDVIRRINESPWRGANFGQNQPTPNRPPPITGWRAVLGACADLAAVNAAYHRLAQSAHPDHGGSTERMVALTAARDAARKELAR